MRTTLLKWECPRCKASVKPNVMAEQRRHPKRKCKWCDHKLEDFKPVYLYEHGKPFIVKNGKTI